jgi:hypothetical protein
LLATRLHVKQYEERFDFRMASDFGGTRMGARGQELVGRWRQMEFMEFMEFIEFIETGDALETR